MGFYLLQENVKNRIDELVDEATSPNRKRKIVEIFDELSDSICRVADMVSHINIYNINPLCANRFFLLV